MTIVRWEPLRELSSLQSEMNRLFNTVFDTPAAGNGGARRWTPAMDLVETDDHFVLRADLPGMTEDDVTIELEDNVAHRLRRAQGRARGQARGLLPRGARLRRVLPLADAARRAIDAEAVTRGVRQRRARGAHPQARAAQAAQDHDRRRRASRRRSRARA